MSIFWQHAALALPSIAAVVVALLNRRTIREVRVTLNGRIDELKRERETEDADE